jgi:endonuclease-3
MNKKKKMKTVIKVLKRLYNTEHYLARNKFMLLIGTILSQRTRDENTAKAEHNLFSVAKTPEEILRLPMQRLQKLIRVSGPYRQKAIRIKAVSKIILEKYKGKVPRTRHELLELPGVGFKTADIVLSYGYGIPTIAVDTHVNRIPRRIGTVSESADIEEARKELEKLTPTKDRFVVNLGLVQFGQNICRPIKPRCDICPIRRICRYYRTVFSR